MSATEPIADGALMWTCACGRREWAHYEWCASCGAARPAPEAKAEPSEVPLDETMPGYT